MNIPGKIPRILPPIFVRAGGKIADYFFPGCLELGDLFFRSIVEVNVIQIDGIAGI